MPPVSKAELKEGGLFSKWEAIANKYDTLNDQLSDPAVLSQPTLLVALNKERAELEPIAQLFDGYRRVVEEISQARLMAEDPQLDADMRRLAGEELQSLDSQREAMEAQVIELLCPA
ncbi:MAG: PCRF domain-containing protein, partial [Nitrospirota bacterium]|nr:PCRF domain-containing protein [Nitrospirota bacterium]